MICESKTSLAVLYYKVPPGYLLKELKWLRRVKKVVDPREADQRFNGIGVLSTRKTG